MRVMAVPLRLRRPIRFRPIRLLSRTAYYVGCTIIAVFFLAPLVWAIVTSLKPPREASAAPPTFLPSQLSFGNYQHLANFNDGIGTYAFNSTVVALGTVAGTILLSTLAGYGFSRFRFPGRNVLFVMILVTLMVPFQSILTPLFLVLKTLHLLNNLLGLTLVYITFQLPFGVFVMRNAFDSVPKEIEEAGLIDGCSSLSLLYRVMLAMVYPGIITVALFAFFSSWNEFLAALFFMTNGSKFTLPVMLLNAASGQYNTIDWGLVQAGVTITMLPCLLLFLLLQRYYIGGLAAGAVKA
jgi:multiple sugar transport system permease protein